jgi:DNA polymerase-1
MSTPLLVKVPAATGASERRGEMDIPRARWYLSGVSGAKTAQRLCLVDGSGILYRAFHALPSLTTRTGLPTGAVYGFTSMLVKLLREHDCSHIAVAFDARGRTFRDDAYAEYKATRAATPPDLLTQAPYVRRIVEALGIPILEVEGVEADDVIGTLAAAAASRGFDVVIVTSDKDMMQLVRPGVSLLDTMHDRVTRVAEVHERFGVAPDQVVDVMALMGDSIDNIPGVKGIGEKTASRLIAHFGSIDAMYARLAEIDGLGLRGAQRIRATLEAGEESARQSRFLATIRTDVPLAVEVGGLVRGEPDRAKLRRLADELEFAKLLKDFVADDASALARPIEIVPPATVERWLAQGGPIALGFGAASSPADAALPGFGAAAPGVALAVPGEGPVFWCEAIPDGVARLLASGDGGSGTVFVADLKTSLHRFGLDAALPAVEGARLCDLSLAAYVADPSRRAYTADALASERLGRSLPDPATAPPQARAAAVASALLELGPALVAELEAAGLSALYRDLEMPLARVLAVVEARGLLVDREALERAGGEFRAAADKLEAEIYELAGGPFNLSSPNQLREVLFERLHLPTKGVKRGKTGLSVDADVLARLAESHPIAAKVCDHRALQKLVSTYVTSLLSLVDPRTGRLHTTIHQTVAATGRLSSSDPNLQNIPVRSAEGRRIREAFVAPPGMLLLACDYSQIELRVLAHLTEDPVLVAAFRSGEDIHRRTAAEVFGVAPEAVTTDMRRQAKVINFGVLYGMGPQRLSRELGIPLADAEEYIRRYFERYGRVRAFADGILEAGRRDGFVATMIGRRRYLPDLASRVPNLRQAAERMAWNSPIQGTAADIIKLAMLRVERELGGSPTGARMLLQVHDELLLEVPAERAQAAGELVRRCMESVVELAVPLVVDVKTGPNWAAMR